MSAASAVAGGGGLVGTGLQIYGDITSANDQAQMDADRAQIAGEQATEIAAREQANEQIRDQVAYRQKLQFGASYAASGKAGVGVGSMLQIQNQTDLQDVISNREALFQANMLRQQAGIDTTLGEETVEAGDLNAVAAGVSGATKIAGAAMSGGASAGGTQGLGAYPGMGGGSGKVMSAPSLGSGFNGGG